MEMNTITFCGIKTTRALEREVEKRLEKWIRREQGWLHCGKPWTYSVEIERDGSPHFYHCSLRIIANEEWSSHGCGKTLHDAITDALRHVRPVMVMSMSHQHAAAHAM
jgi:hypothetical protein